MKSTNLFILVASLALVTLASSRTLKPAKKGTKKAGSCPNDPFRCIRGEPSECLGDELCPGKQKCCYYHCGFKCVNPKTTHDPASIKPGQCPPQVNVCLTSHQCEDDGHCQGAMKCCEALCGNVCVAPMAD